MNLKALESIYVNKHPLASATTTYKVGGRRLWGEVQIKFEFMTEDRYAGDDDH